MPQEPQDVLGGFAPQVWDSQALVQPTTRPCAPSRGVLLERASSEVRNAGQGNPSNSGSSLQNQWPTLLGSYALLPDVGRQECPV